MKRRNRIALLIVLVLFLIAAGYVLIKAAARKSFLDAVASGDFYTVQSCLRRFPDLAREKYDRDPRKQYYPWQFRVQCVISLKQQGVALETYILECHYAPFISNLQTFPDTGSSEWTPLNYALKRGHIHIAELLVKCDADVNSRDAEGMTPLMHAVEKADARIARILLEHGADPVSHDRYHTALHKAASSGNIEMARLLLDHGAQVDSPDACGCTPLHIAATPWTESVEMLELLLSRGATVNAKDRVGAIPLHRAAYRGYLRTVEILLAHGADRHATAADGRTPLDLARVANHAEVIELLQRGAAN